MRRGLSAKVMRSQSCSTEARRRGASPTHRRRAGQQRRPADLGPSSARHPRRVTRRLIAGKKKKVEKERKSTFLSLNPDHGHLQPRLKLPSSPSVVTHPGCNPSEAWLYALTAMAFRTIDMPEKLSVATTPAATSREPQVWYKNPLTPCLAPTGDGPPKE